MAYDWSARCTAEHCRYGVRTGSYVNVSSRAGKHAREHSGHVVNVTQGGKVRFQVPSAASSARAQSTDPLF